MIHEKDYERRFLLEPTKLARIVDKIHECLAEHQNTTLHDKFEVFQSRNLHEESTTVDDVLAVDNSRRRKIERLLLSCSASTPGAPKAEHEVQVDFGRLKAASGTPGSTTRVVSINVRSDAPGWASRTLGKVEEQVERTWLHDTPLLLALIGLLVVVLLFLGSQFLSLQPLPSAQYMWLTNADLDRIEAMLEQRPALTDEDLRTVTSMQLRNILETRRPSPSPDKGLARRALLLGLPLLVVAGCILYLLIWCYPGAVFLWGDEKARYDNIVQRRKTIWGIIIGVTLLGLLPRFLYEGISPSLPPAR